MAGVCWLAGEPLSIAWSAATAPHTAVGYMIVTGILSTARWHLTRQVLEEYLLTVTVRSRIVLFVEIMIKIFEEAKNDPNLLKTAPHCTPIKRLDAVLAARKPILHD